MNKKIRLTFEGVDFEVELDEFGQGKAINGLFSFISLEGFVDPPRIAIFDQDVHIGTAALEGSEEESRFDHTYCIIGG